MKLNNIKIKSVISVVVCILIVSFCQSAIAAPQVSTDKKSYNYGEPINVNFSGAPGYDSDWICIAGVGSPDTEAGDYKYMPKGQTQGVLTFDSPSSPGEYEVRAFYNYSTTGYTVAARYAFSVGTTPEYEKLAVQRLERMERKINPNNPLEANLSPEKGLVYIFREPWAVSSRADAKLRPMGNQLLLCRQNIISFPLLPEMSPFQQETSLIAVFKPGSRK